jgi:hypothetical protein
MGEKHGKSGDMVGDVMGYVTHQLFFWCWIIMLDK